MVILAGLSLLIVAFVNINALNNSVTRNGRIIRDIYNLAVLGLESRLFSEENLKT